MIFHDRVTDVATTPQPGWTGRWATACGEPALDPDTGTSSRDLIESDDLDAVWSLRAELEAADHARSWLEMCDARLLAGHETALLELQPCERELQEHLGSIARIAERFVTRLREDAELMPVSRVKRPARKALERLAGHTEDWAGRTLAGPVPRRALAVTRYENADLYENRMVSELVHPVLTTAVGGRARQLRRLRSDLVDLRRAQDEGTHRRRDRLYRFWGHDVASASETSSQVDATLAALEKLYASLTSLRGSTLVRAMGSRRTGQRRLRRTNVIANDRHYRAAGIVWSAYEREPEVEESPAEREARLRHRHRTYDRYVFGLVLRSLSDLGADPNDDDMPGKGEGLTCAGPWGKGELRRQQDGVMTVTSEGIMTRIVPMVDLVGPDDDDATIRARWDEVRSNVSSPTVVVYLAPRGRHLPAETAMAMTSAGPDTPLQTEPCWAVPASPLETTSLERVARAVTLAMLLPALKAYPPTLRIKGDPPSRRMIESLIAAGIGSSGMSPVFHRPEIDRIHVRRPLVTAEVQRLTTLVAELRMRSRGTDWERDRVEEIGGLQQAVVEASGRVEALLNCPLCRHRASPGDLAREGDVLVVRCRSCSGRWGHERCGGCGARVPFVEPARQPNLFGGTGPGWVERVFGQDALASPCWTGRQLGPYICPDCRKCPLTGSPAAAGCSRCDKPETPDFSRDRDERS